VALATRSEPVIPNGKDNEEGFLVRAADLIGQLGDPHYLRKANALYYEFEEVGMNRQLGYTSPADLTDQYPQFKGGEISLKHGNTLIGRLRISYGSGFAKGCADDEKLSDVLAKLDEPSLFRLVRDYKTGMLPIRLRTPWIIAPRL
jgi:hypothetical protein